MHKNKCLIIFIFLFFFVNPAYANVRADPPPISQGTFDQILNAYKKAATKWESTFLKAGGRLFWSLAIISLAWTLGQMVLRKADLSELFAEFIRFTLFVGFFWWLLNNSAYFATSILKSLIALANQATDITILSPSQIMDLGFGFLHFTLNGLKVTTPATWFAFLIALMIFIILTVIAANMLILMCSGWILAYAGIFFLGFGGSRWTSDIAINYYKTILGLASQFMAMILLIGLGHEFLKLSLDEMSKTGYTISAAMTPLGIAIVLLMLCNKIPMLISGVITGSAIGSMGMGPLGGSDVKDAANLATSSLKSAASIIKTGASMIKSVAGGKSSSNKNSSSQSGSEINRSNNVFGYNNMGMFGRASNSSEKTFNPNDKSNSSQSSKSSSSAKGNTSEKTLKK